jgi:hypothetical protein
MIIEEKFDERGRVIYSKDDGYDYNPLIDAVVPGLFSNSSETWYSYDDDGTVHFKRKYSDGTEEYQ